MTEPDKLESLIERWEDLRRKGHNTSAEEICAGHPEVLDEFIDRVKKLKMFDSVFGDPSPSDAAGAIEEFCHGRYQVEVQHGQGGLGALYLARDNELGRTVIVKGIRADYANKTESQRQFVNEAVITGQLEHPGVVPVYGFGRDPNGRPYYAMRMIRGTNLGEAIRQFHTETAADADRNVRFQRLIRDFLSVCQTIDFAHSRGVIHRDIKPANIMLGKFGEVLVVDWGLAKHVGSADAAAAAIESVEPISVPHAAETRLGAVKGSPMYMSPEQADGRTEEIGPASDIYGLGATLYELIAGRAPFEGSSSQAIVEQVRLGNVRPPRAVKPDVPPALEAICLKAMSRDPQARYAAAAHLAADIERFLADEPVQVYAEPLADKARRWARKHRALVASAAATLVLAVVALAGTSALLTRHNRDLAVAKSAAEGAERAERRRAAELEKSLYVNQLMTAGEAWREADLHRTRDVLAKTNPKLRGLEWNLAERLSEPPPRLPFQQYSRPPRMYRITRLTPSPDGTWLAEENLGPQVGSGSTVRTTHVIAASDGAPKLGAGAGFLAFSPDGTRVLRREAVDGQPPSKQYRLSLVEVASGRTLWRTEPLEDKSYNLFAASFFVPDADAGRTQQIVVLTDPWARAEGAGQYRAAQFEFRDAQTGQLLRTVDGDDVGNATRATFSSDGRLLALSTSAPDTHAIAILSPATGKTLYALTGHDGRVNGVAFSDDSRHIATASADRSVRIWDAASGQPLAVLWGLRGPALTVAFDPAGDQVAGAGDDGSVRIWRIANGELRTVLPVADDEIYALAFSRDGKILYAGGTEGMVIRFDSSKQPAAELIREDDFVRRVRLSPTGDTVAAVVSGAASKVRVYDRAGGKLKFEVSLLDPQSKSAALYTEDAAFSPDGTVLLVSGENFVRCLDAQSGTQRWETRGFEAPFGFTPDGKRLVAFRNRRDLVDIIKAENLLDQIRGDEAKNIIGNAIKFGAHIFAAHAGGDADLLKYLAKDPGNKALTATIQDKARGAFVVLDAASGKTLRVLNGDADFTNRFAMHPRHPIIAIPRDDTVSLVDLDSGKETTRFKVKYPKIWSLAFSPDGSNLAVVGIQENAASISDVLDMRISIVDVASGKERFTLTGSAHRFQDATYTPDGRRIVTCSFDGMLRVWDAESGVELWTVEASRWPLYSTGISKDGRFMAAGGGNNKTAGEGEILVWNVSPPKP